MNNIAQYEDTELRCFDTALYAAHARLETEAGQRIAKLLEGLTPAEKLDRLNEYEQER